MSQQYVKLDRPAVSGQAKPLANPINLDRLINNSERRESTWSLSPQVASWNDLWPSPGQQMPVNDAPV